MCMSVEWGGTKQDRVIAYVHGGFSVGYLVSWCMIAMCSFSRGRQEEYMSEGAAHNGRYWKVEGSSQKTSHEAKNRSLRQ